MVVSCFFSRSVLLEASGYGRLKGGSGHQRRAQIADYQLGKMCLLYFSSAHP